MKRKIVQTGGSLAVTLPSDVVEELGLRKGHEVDVSVHPVTGAVIIRPDARLVDAGKVSKQFEKAARQLLQRRAELYRQLAK